MYSLKSTKKISVIVTVSDRPHLLEHTLDTLTKQSMPSRELEVIVVNHKNNTMVDVIVSNYQKHLDIVNINYDHDEWSEPAARNLAIGCADANICLMVKCGSLLGSECTAEHWNTHASNLRVVSTIGFTYGNCGRQLHIDNVMDLVKKHGTDDLISYFFNKKMYKDVRDESYLRFNHKIHYLPAPWAFFSESNISINRQSFIKQSIYDERFTLGNGYEDLDLGYRIYNQGGKIFLNRDAECINYPQPNAPVADKKISSDAAYFFSKHAGKVVQLFDTYGELELNDQIMNRSYGEMLEAI